MSVPYRPGTLTYGLQDKTGSRVWYHALPCVSQPRTTLFCKGGLQCCHVGCSSGRLLIVEEGSGVVMCPVAPDLASLPRRAPMLLCVPWLWTHLPAEEGSSVVTRLAAPDPNFPLRRALTLPCVPRHSVGHGPQV
jgi:hypothetical protein